MPLAPCHRFEGNVDDTEALLAFILTHLKVDDRVSFICPAGKGKAYMSRVRAMLSRVRKRLEQKGKLRQHFYMLSDVVPWTLEGKRYDCVFVHRKVTDAQKMLENFESMIGHSSRL